MENIYCQAQEKECQFIRTQEAWDVSALLYLHYFNSDVNIIILLLEVIKLPLLLTLSNYEAFNLLFNYLRQTYCHTVLFHGIMNTQNIVFPEARDINIARDEQMTQ